jgi:2-oxoglutarate dehydrogenase E2 component (dihydrolipoamide succinyltransferase)
MTVEIHVPVLGESVSEATVGKWYKAVGDAVAVDEVICELETDKVALEVTASSAGALSEIVAEEGENVEVGALLAKIDETAKGAATAAPYWSADTSSAHHVQSSTAAKDVHWSADASSAQHDTSSSMGAVRESGPGALRRGVTLTATGVYLGPLTLNLKVLNH